jgi:hypothetical protein
VRRSSTAAAVAACLALAAAQAAGAAGAAPRGPAHAKYELALAWHDKSGVLDGTERLSFENARANAIHSVWLRLWPNGVASCAHPRVTVKLLSGGSAAGRRTACTAQKVHLNRALGHGKRAAIKFHFSVRVPSGTGSFGRSQDGPALLGNALPILAVADGGGTHLEPYSPIGEAGYSLVSSWKVTLQLAPGLSAATTGVETKHLTFEAPHARDFELAIAHFHRQSTTAGQTRIRLFDTHASGSSTSALRTELLAAARDDLLGYEQRFGDYSPPELDIVQSRSIDGEGMEYPELVFVQVPPGADASDEAGLLAHEIAHQWFYGIVGNNQWREPFLDESFATFASGFPGHGCSPGDPLSGYPSSVRLSSTMGFFDARPDSYYYGGLYGGGACALRDLRSGLGSQRFDALLRDWVAGHRYRIGTIAGFVKAIRAHAPPGFDVDGYLSASRIDAR